MESLLDKILSKKTKSDQEQQFAKIKFIYWQSVDNPLASVLEVSLENSFSTT
jgi:hypothetical protein